MIQWVKHLATEIERLRPEIENTVGDVELDEMWHFIQKTQKCWVWLAWDRQQKRCVGVELGRRNTQTGKGLWKQLNLFEGSTVFTDDFPAYDSIVEGGYACGRQG